jgi:hypothetical protein
VDVREAGTQKSDSRRPKSVTPRTETVSARSSDRSHGGSTTARSDRSVTEVDGSQASSVSYESKLKADGRNGRSDRNGSNKQSSTRTSARDSDVAEELSTAADSEPNRKRYKRNGEPSREIPRKDTADRRLVESCSTFL